MRWPDGPRCPHCGNARAYFLRPVAETGTRRTRTGSATARRVWKCGACRRQFSVLTATIWHGTRLDVPTWIALVRHAANHGLPAPGELERGWGLSAEAARHVRRLLGPASAGLLRGGDVGVCASDRGEHLLAALLSIEGARAARLRHAAVRRARPLRQQGPVADYGNP